MRGQGARQVLRQALAEDRRGLVVSSLLVAGHQLAEAAVPVVVGVVVDRALGTGSAGALGRWLVVVTVVFGVLAGSAYVGYWTAMRTERRAANAVRMRVAARVLDPGGGAPGGQGELLSLAGSDADRTALVCRAVAAGAGAVAALVGGAVVLLQSSAVLGLVVLLGIPLVLVASRLLSRPLVARAEAEQQALAGAVDVATELVTGVRVLRGIGAEDAATDGYVRASQAALRARLRAARAVGGYDAVTGVLTGCLLVVVTWVGGRLALSGSISVGELVAGVGLAQFLLGPLERLAELGPVLAGARGSATRVAELLGAPPAVRGGTGNVSIEGAGSLTARLPGGAVLDVVAGEHVGVVCLRAADGAALLDLLARDADGGALVVDGTDLHTVDLDRARETVLVARHDAALIESTVAEATGCAPAVLAAAGADDVVAALPGGLSTPLAERGRALSGGQRQRLLLARALAADPAVLVLHDPTTAVDAVTEGRIAEGVSGLRRGRTTVLLTSSPALLARCTRVLLLEDGRVLAEGTHADLVADARYRTAVLS